MAGYYVVRGNTYDNRDALRRMGLTWDADRKAWIVCGANMGRQPYYSDRAKYEAVERAIQDGRLDGCWMEWTR